ncbi:hypothetical protein OIU77_022298 [Salix suchowensis]|uniref:Uncharacterized protein n=1 Tax=Salix suchowensis TaxID=1278906 RepID=A0ABQ9C3D7_9ROSI|nr:hypothetical protein OIU78_009189 [Salix suchowensis]KAJ6392783.1 hypothetical protein OIU77_022298 [Salix suchowensis]
MRRGSLSCPKIFSWPVELEERELKQLSY